LRVKVIHSTLATVMTTGLMVAKTATVVLVVIIAMNKPTVAVYTK